MWWQVFTYEHVFIMTTASYLNSCPLSCLVLNCVTTILSIPSSPEPKEGMRWNKEKAWVYWSVIHLGSPTQNIHTQKAHHCMYLSEGHTSQSHLGLLNTIVILQSCWAKSKQLGQTFNCTQRQRSLSQTSLQGAIYICLSCLVVLFLPNTCQVIRKKRLQGEWY